MFQLITNPMPAIQQAAVEECEASLSFWPNESRQKYVLKEFEKQKLLKKTNKNKLATL